MKFSNEILIVVLIAVAVSLIMGFGLVAVQADDIVISIIAIFFVSTYTFFILSLSIFWLYILIDCLKRPAHLFPSRGEYDKLIWVLVIIFIHFIGALLYYYLVKNREFGRTRLQVNRSY